MSTRPTITAAEVKALRDRTGAGMMDCKKALTETDGDIDKAVELLRVKLGDKALKLGGRETTEGTVQSYIHSNGKVGVLVEVDCNTDFVARNDDFVDFAKDVALHIAAHARRPLRRPRTRSRRTPRRPSCASSSSRPPTSPRTCAPKIAEGKLRKWLEEVVLLNQQHVNADKYDGKTIEQIRAELSGKTGENVVIRRFARFQVGGVTRWRPPSSASCSSSRARR